MIELDEQQQRARTWFESLRDAICAEFEAIEAEAGSDARFDYLAWDRTDPERRAGRRRRARRDEGQGVREGRRQRLDRRRALEGDFAKTIHGAGEDPSFFATGISLVAHMANPHVPAVHMNTRFLCTTKRWFGGGADLNPPIPYAEDTAEFHAALKAACDAHDPEHYPRFRKWADDYFYIPHRKVHRGVGGIFYDHLEGGQNDWDANFAFTQDVGRAFLDVFPRWCAADGDAVHRGRQGAAARMARPLCRVQPDL
jgi:coproporphyrinogen III oxidase